jgi:ribosome-associated toxin RatA of RatAB toxin-antitoxin module
MRSWTLVVALGLLLPLAAWADTLDSLLARGEVVLVETQPDGHLKQVTGISRIDAPASDVWAKLVDFEAYPEWMSNCAKAEVTESGENYAVVDWSVRVPGPNVKFSGRYDYDPAAWTIIGTHTGGALEGSHWEWRLVPDGDQTVMYRTVFSNVVADNWLVRQFEDEHHSMEFGLNAATPVIELIAVKNAFASSEEGDTTDESP